MARISGEGTRLLAGCPELPRLKRRVLTHNRPRRFRVTGP
jgi:hypothetical protein